MKSLKEYIFESLSSTIDRKLVVRLMDEESRNAWKDAAIRSQETHKANVEISLKDEKEKRDFNAWLNDTIYNREFNLKLAAPGTYELFYLPAEKAESYKSEKAKKLLDDFYARSRNNPISIEPCDCAASEGFNEAKASNLTTKDLKYIKDYYKHSALFKRRLKEADFVKLIDRILDFIPQSNLEQIKDDSLSYNTRYGVLSNILGDILDDVGIYDSDEEYIDMFDELLEILTTIFDL